MYPNYKKLIAKDRPANLSADAFADALADIEDIITHYADRLHSKADEPSIERVKGICYDAFKSFKYPHGADAVSIFYLSSEFDTVEHDAETLAPIVAKYLDDRDEKLAHDMGKEKSINPRTGKRQNQQYINCLKYCLEWVDKHEKEIKEDENLAEVLAETEKRIKTDKKRIATLEKFTIPKKKNGEEFADFLRALNQYGTEEERKNRGYTSRVEDRWGSITLNILPYGSPYDEEFQVNIKFCNTDIKSAPEMRAEIQREIERYQLEIAKYQEQIKVLKKIYRPYLKLMGQINDLKMDLKNVGGYMPKALEEQGERARGSKWKV